MNSPLSLPRCAAALAFAALTGLLAGCGQKGPLYLQPKPAPAATPAAATTPPAKPAVPATP